MVRLASSAMVIGAGFSKIGSGPSPALAPAVAIRPHSAMTSIVISPIHLINSLID